MDEDEPSEPTTPLSLALQELARLRRLLAKGRSGASPAWIEAAETAIMKAELAVVRAGGDPRGVGLDGRTASQDDAGDPEVRDDAYG